MKPSKALTIGLGCLALGLATSRAEEPSSTRMWTDKQGRQVKASFVGLDGDKISIQTDAGQLFTFALSNLSPEDQAFAKTAKPAVAYITNDATVAQASHKIDLLVAKGLELGAKKIRFNNERATQESDKRVVPTPNPLMSDEQFVRRVYLDIVGRIPNYTEAKEFLDSTSKVKRADLIKSLLNSPGYNAHTFNYFAEMLRIKDRLDGGQNMRGTPYINWLQREIAENATWDKMVYKMITAEGKAWDSGGATGYLLRDIGMPLDNLANTLAVFLGTDVSCAQCHDHPFADWTQHQFYQMAAYFGATTTDARVAAKRQSKAKGKEMAMVDRNELMGKLEELITAGGGDIKKERNGLGTFIAPNRYEVSDTNENVLKLPMDYKYKDAKPGDLVQPKLIMWNPKADASNPAYKETKTKKAERLRDSFATWLTHPENPRFAMAIANRMWKRAFGVAINEPVTNIDDPAKSSNPELLMHLAAEMKRVKFDLKKFMEIVYNTETYQREATKEAVPMGEPYYFQGPQLRRMSAEQAWDSYMTLVLGSEIDARKKPLDNLYEKTYSLDLRNPKLDPRVVLQKYAAAKNMGAKEREFEGGGMEEEGMMMDKKEKEQSAVRYGGVSLRRASELEQPMRGGSFLADFGQSSRQIIDGGMKNGSVPQVLMMMNGESQTMLTNPSVSLIFKNMEKLSTPAEKVECIFLSTLNRKPTAAEAQKALSAVSAGNEGYSDLIWALINTREFIFVQ